MGKRDLCATLLGGTIFRFRRFCPPRNRLIILNYHRVRAVRPDWSTPFDDGVYDTDEVDFRRHVRWLKSRTRILRERELLDILETRRFPEEPCSLITFDDGYVDNYTRALPILLSEGATAVFFIATGLVAQRRLGWWDLLAYAVKRSRAAAAEWRGEVISLADRPAAIRRLQRIMKSRPSHETETLVATIARQCGVELPGPSAQDAELMTWDQIREMDAKGMDIGAHTHSHQVLSTLPLSEQENEIRASKALLEEALRRPVHSLAYPVGGPSSFTRETSRIAASAGLTMAFSYGPQTNDWLTLNRHDIHRLPTPAGVTRLAACAVFPGVFAG